MKKLTITITVTDPEILEAYEEASENLIADDFLGCPETWFETWLEGAEIEVAKE